MSIIRRGNKMAGHGQDDPTAGSRFGRWYRSRPTIGGLLIVLAGVEMLFSGQLDLGNIRIQVGMEGMQAMILPIALITLGVLIAAMPAHRMFYGIMSLTFSVYALVGVNLGGFFIGTLLGVTGGVVAVSWLPRRTAAVGSTESEEHTAENVPAESVPAEREPADLTALGLESPDIASAPPFRRRQANALAILALAVLLGSASVGLAAGPSFADAGVATPAPTAPAASSPVPTPDPGQTLTPTQAPAPASTPTPTPAPPAITAPQPAAPPVAPVAAPAVGVQDAPVAGIPVARLRSASVTLEGARYFDTVTVTLADGSTRAALKITADRVVMDAFSLDSINPDAHTSTTNASRVSLAGTVTMYCTSLSGNLPDGTTVSFDPSTPPPKDVDLPSLTSATVGLHSVASATATLTGAAMSVG